MKLILGRSDPIPCYHIRVLIIANHLNGKDTHLRGLKVFGPADPSVKCVPRPPPDMVNYQDLDLSADRCLGPVRCLDCRNYQFRIHQSAKPEMKVWKSYGWAMIT